jgi:nicotinic acid phosphoribosyltransferase
MNNFLMFDFKIKSIPYSDEYQFIVVKTFENKRQAKKYYKIITKRSDVFTKLRKVDYTQFLITEENLNVLRTDKDLEKYMRFYNKNY